MDLYQFFVGLSLFLLGFFILILQHRDNFKKGSKRSNTSTGLTLAGIFGMMVGIFFIIQAL